MARFGINFVGRLIEIAEGVSEHSFFKFSVAIFERGPTSRTSYAMVRLGWVSPP